ncbi:MAG: cellulase, partial [Herminiimonas sp.]|nr:cellulase [Herminiimonas sp.]
MRLASRSAAAALGAGLLLHAAAGLATADCRSRPAAVGWPAWDSFAGTFIGDGARVIDPSTPNGRTTSEGQAYALFFALVANDRARFERLLRWTEDNLAAGDLRAHLPAWLWGKRDDGSWGVIDDNPASDADLWIAYALQEAARLWDIPRYAALGQLIAERILREETVVVGGLGRVLLPAPKGFMPATDTVRLNPSYAPIQLLRRLAAGSISAESTAQWRAQIGTTRRLTIEGAPRGFVPDWVVYQAGQGFRTDADTAGVGSFNAIRSYLWAGMLAPSDPLRASLQRALAPMLQVTARTGTPPKQVDTRTGSGIGSGDAGFSAALLPMLSSLPG